MSAVPLLIVYTVGTGSTCRSLGLELTPSYYWQPCRVKAAFTLHSDPITSLSPLIFSSFSFLLMFEYFLCFLLSGSLTAQSVVAAAEQGCERSVP